MPLMRQGGRTRWWGENTIFLLPSHTLTFFSFLSPSSGIRPGMLPTLPAGWE